MGRRAGEYGMTAEPPRRVMLKHAAAWAGQQARSHSVHVAGATHDLTYARRALVGAPLVRLAAAGTARGRCSNGHQPGAPRLTCCGHGSERERGLARKGDGRTNMTWVIVAMVSRLCAKFGFSQPWHREKTKITKKNLKKGLLACLTKHSSAVLGRKWGVNRLPRHGAATLNRAGRRQPGCSLGRWHAPLSPGVGGVLTAVAAAPGRHQDSTANAAWASRPISSMLKWPPRRPRGGINVAIFMKF